MTPKGLTTLPVILALQDWFFRFLFVYSYGFFELMHFYELFFRTASSCRPLTFQSHHIPGKSVQLWDVERLLMVSGAQQLVKRLGQNREVQLVQQLGLAFDLARLVLGLVEESLRETGV